MKSNQVISCAVDRERMKMDFSVRGAGKFTFDIERAGNTAGANLSAVGLEAMIHGFRQKISDAAAIGRDPETGASATPQEKLDAMLAVAERLEMGLWNATGGGEPRGGVLFAALCELYPQRTAAEVREWLAGKSRADQAKLRASKSVAEKILEIQARNADGSAGDSMLDELGGM